MKKVLIEIHSSPVKGQNLKVVANDKEFQSSGGGQGKGVGGSETFRMVTLLWLAHEKP